MKVITIAAALLLATPLCVIAQQHAAPTPADEYVEQIIQNLISPPQLANKTTEAVKERLIGESVWEFKDSVTQIPTLLDTTYYMYSGNRGSGWDTQFGLSWYYNSLFQMPMGFVGLYTPVNYVRNGHPLIQPDVRVSREIATGVTDSASFTYNANNDVLTFFDSVSHTFGPQFPFTVNEYDAFGKIVKQTIFSSLDLDHVKAERNIVYNTSGTLIIDSMMMNPDFSTVTNVKFVYNYNSGGNIMQLNCYSSPTTDPGNWQHSSDYVLDYYDFGKIKKIILSTGGQIYTDSFGWTPDHKVLNHRSYNSPNLYPWKYFVSNHLSSDMLIDTSVRYHVDVITGDTIDLYRFVYEYDDYKRPTHIKQLGNPLFTKPTNQLFYQTNYYYEKYDTTKNPAPGSVVITVYPVPVNITLNILFTGITQATPFSLRLIDMAGKVAVKCDVLYTTTPIEIPMNNLASGVYILEAIDNDTHQRYIEKVVKY